MQNIYRPTGGDTEWNSSIEAASIVLVLHPAYQFLCWSKQPLYADQNSFYAGRSSFYADRSSFYADRSSLYDGLNSFFVNRSNGP